MRDLYSKMSEPQCASIESKRDVAKKKLQLKTSALLTLVLSTFAVRVFGQDLLMLQCI